MYAKDAGNSDVSNIRKKKSVVYSNAEGLGERMQQKIKEMLIKIKDKQKITLVFLPGLTADHRLFEKQTEYFEKRQNVFVWDAPSHALSRPFTNNYSLSGMAEWLYLH